jgi:putative peptidoglycan lipid II flippase
VGLALATSIAALLNASLLFRGLRRAGVFELEPGWLPFIGRLLLANAVMVLVLVALSGDWGSWLEQGVWVRVGQLTVLVLAGLGAYLCVLLALGLRPRQFYR